MKTKTWNISESIRANFRNSVVLHTEHSHHDRWFVANMNDLERLSHLQNGVVKVYEVFAAGPGALHHVRLGILEWDQSGFVLTLDLGDDHGESAALDGQTFRSDPNPTGFLHRDLKQMLQPYLEASAQALSEKLNKVIFSEDK